MLRELNINNRTIAMINISALSSLSILPNLVFFPIVIDGNLGRYRSYFMYLYCYIFVLICLRPVYYIINIKIKKILKK